MIESHPPRNLAIAQFIQEFGRQPDDDELVDIEQRMLELEYLAQHGGLPDAQQLQDFRIQKILLRSERPQDGKTDGGVG